MDTLCSDLQNCVYSDLYSLIHSDMNVEFKQKVRFRSLMEEMLVYRWWIRSGFIFKQYNKSSFEECKILGNNHTQYNYTYWKTTIAHNIMKLRERESNHHDDNDINIAPLKVRSHVYGDPYMDYEEAVLCIV